MVGTAVLLAVAAEGMPALAVQPRIFYVDKGWGDDGYDGLSPDRPFATIETAIRAAVSGDTVFVYPGLYRETLDFSGKALTLKGIAGPQGTPVIEGLDQAAVLMLTREGREAVLQNLVIRNSLMGLCILDSSPTLLNLTVVDCGIGLVALGGAHPQVNSCIFWRNTLTDLSGARAEYSCVQQLDESVLTSNISQDPLFVDPNRGDYHLQSQEGRYAWRLDRWSLDEVTSPCINAGDPNRDCSQEPAPNGSRIDMGAYGGTLYGSLSSNLSPTVTITSQGLRSGPGGVFASFGAAANDPDGQVVKVEFYADGVKMAEDHDGANGWFVEWQIQEQTSLEIVAVAQDDDGVRSLSKPVQYAARRSGR